MKKKALGFFVWIVILLGLSTQVCANGTLEQTGSYTVPDAKLSFLAINNFETKTQGRITWYSQRQLKQVVCFDTQKAQNILFVPVPVTFSEGLCWNDKESLWVCDSAENTIKLISIPGGKLLRTLSPPGSGPAGLAIFKGCLWNIDFHTKKMYQMNPLDGKIVKTFTIPANAEGMTSTDQALYFIADNYLHEFDDVKGVIKASYALPVASAMGLSWDGRRFHISTLNGETILMFRIL